MKWLTDLWHKLMNDDERHRKQPATRQDLADAERRIIAAIGNQISAADLRLLEGIEARVGRLAVRLEKLDEQTG